MIRIKDINVESISSLSDLKVPILSVSSSAPLKGKVAYDIATNKFAFANGEDWFAASGTTVGGVLTGTLPNPGLASGVVTGANIVDGTITSAQLANTGTTAGTYGNSTHTAGFTVNSGGQIEAASNIFIVGGTITHVNTGTGLTGGPVTTTGTISLADTAVVQGTYGSASAVPVVTVNQQGQITSITTTPLLVNPALICEYFISIDTVVATNDTIEFDGTVSQETGTMSAGVFTATEPGVYSITFCGININGKGKYQMLLNGAFGVGARIGYCEQGSDFSLVPHMIHIVGTASMTINQALSAGSTIQVASIGGGLCTVQGTGNGPATLLLITKLA